MKLRLTDQSVRLRLNKVDIQSLQKENVLSVSVPLTHPDGMYFTYTLKPCSQVTTTLIKLIAHEFLIEVPAHLIDQWIVGEDVGIYQGVMTSTGQMIQLIIEKDFQCTSDPIDTTLYFTNPKVD